MLLLALLLAATSAPLPTAPPPTGPPPTAPAASSSSPSPSPSRAATHLPVVIAPGFLGWDRLPLFDRYLETMAAALEAEGYDVTMVQPPAVAGSEIRVEALVRAIDIALHKSGARQVLVVAHSQGGLDVRVALRRPAVKARIAAIVTLATPHDGTPVASLAQRVPGFAVDAALVPVQWAWESFEPMSPEWRSTPSSSGAFGTLALTERGKATFREHGAVPAPRPTTTPTTTATTTTTTTATTTGDGDGDGKIKGAREAAEDARALLDRDPDDVVEAGVPFFSVAGFTGPLGRDDRSCDGGRWTAPRATDDPNPLMLAGRTAHALEGWTLANDGIVPAGSSRHGVFLGCVAADHLDWLGWHHNLPGRPAPFDERAFVVTLVAGLEATTTLGVGAMDAFVPRLASLARARPLDAW